MDQRKIFEASVLKRNPDYDEPRFLLERNSAGDYAVVRIQGEWQGWQAAIAAQPQAVAAPDALRSAAHAVIQLALDNACDHVHVCDQNDDLVKIKVCSDEIQALYVALAAAQPEAKAAPFAYFVQPSGFGPFIECAPGQAGAFAAFRAAPAAVAAAQGDAGNSQDAKDAAWLPIETAPSDGSHVLCYAPELQFSGFYAGRSGWCYVAPGVPVAPTQPTHWMPLPAAPVAAPSPAEGA